MGAVDPSRYRNQPWLTVESWESWKNTGCGFRCSEFSLSRNFQPINHHRSHPSLFTVIQGVALSSLSELCSFCLCVSSSEVTVTSVSHPSFVSHRGLFDTDHRSLYHIQTIVLSHAFPLLGSNAVILRLYLRMDLGHSDQI